MKKILFLAAASAALMATPALAQESRVQGSIGYSQMDGSDGDLGAVTGRLGYNFSPNIGVEGEASFGVQEDEFDIAPGVTGDARLEYDAAAYVVGTLPVSPNLELFARAGYGVTEVKVDAAGFTAREDGQSFNYGAGAKFFFDSQNGVRADWTRREFEDDGGQFDIYSLSYVRRF